MVECNKDQALSQVEHAAAWTAARRSKMSLGKLILEHAWVAVRSRGAVRFEHQLNDTFEVFQARGRSESVVVRIPQRVKLLLLVNCGICWH